MYAAIYQNLSCKKLRFLRTPVPVGKPQLTGSSPEMIRWIVTGGAGSTDVGSGLTEHRACTFTMNCRLGKGVIEMMTPYPRRAPRESPRHLCSRKDESVIVGYYTLKKCFPRPAGRKKCLKRRNDDGKK